MSIQKARSDTEAIETSYMSLGMQLKLVLGYLKDDVPDTELARRFLGEAKKMVSELTSIIDGLSETLLKIDRKLGTGAARKAGQLHEYISSTSTDPENGVIKVLDMVDEILVNDTSKAVEYLEALQSSLDRKGALACLAQGINWEALTEEDLVKAVSHGLQTSKGEGRGEPRRARKKGARRASKKMCLIYSASLENDYLIRGLVGKFLNKNGIETSHMTGAAGEGSDESLGESNTIVAFITKDMAGPEKRLPQVRMDDRGKLIVFVESGADVPQEVKDSHELRYFSRDRTGELLLQLLDLI